MKLVSWVKGWPKWAKITGSVLVGLVILGLVFGEDDQSEPVDNGDPPAKAAADTGKKDPAPKPKPESHPKAEEEPEEDPASVLTEKIKGAGGTVQSPVVRDVFVQKKQIVVYLETPEGGFEGASTRDLDEQAGATFREIYRDGWQGSAVIEFQGGLVNSKTGQELPDAFTAAYAIRRGEANQINWDDEDTVRYTIDWGLYRTGLSPAIKK